MLERLENLESRSHLWQSCGAIVARSGYETARRGASVFCDQANPRMGRRRYTPERRSARGSHETTLQNPGWARHPPGRGLATLGTLMQSDKVTPVIDRRYKLSETSEALRYVEAGHARGKVVVTVE